MNFDFESTDEQRNKSGSLPLLEDAHAHGTIPTKQPHIKSPLSRELLHTPNYLTVMMSAEEDQQSPHSNEKHNSHDEEMSINEEGEEDIEDLSQHDSVSNLGMAVDGRSVYTQDDEKNALEILTPSMSGTPTTVKSSSYSIPSPATPGLQPRCMSCFRDISHSTSLLCTSWHL